MTGWNLHQICEELLKQLLDIAEIQGSMANDSYRNLVFYLLFINEEFAKIRSFISVPISNMLDFSWYYITYWYNSQNPSDQYEIPEYSFSPKNPLEQYMMGLIQLVSAERLWEDEMRDNLVKFLSSNEKLVLENLVWFGTFLSTGKTMRFLKPTHGIEMNALLEDLYDRHNLKFLQMFNYNHLGTNNIRQSEYQKAIDYFDKAIEIAESYESRLIPGLRNNLALVYTSTNNLEKAKEVYLDLIDTYPQMPYPYFNLSFLYFSMREFEQSIEYARTFKEKFEHPYVDKYFVEHHSLLKLGQLEEAGKVLAEAIDLVDNNPVTRNTVSIKIMQARQHLYESNFGLAFKLYDEVKQAEYEMGFLSILFNYSIEKIEYQLDYIDIYSKINENARTDLLEDITLLIKLADEQGITYASIEALWLRGRVYHQFGNLDEAKSDTYNAYKLAEKFDFTEIAQDIDTYRTQLLQTDKIDKSSIWQSIKSGIRSLLSVNTTGEIKKEEYQLHGLIIISKEGMPLYDHFFSNRLKSDPTLVSALLAAVSSFMSELTEGKGYLKGITHESLSLVLEPVKGFVVTTIVSRETYDIRLKTKNYGHELSRVLTDYGLTSHPGEITKELQEDLHNVTTNIFT